MARRRYPKYDWSGIAMLTQQLGGLFEPSKAKMQYRQQEHEMRMLEAKHAWKFGEEQLEQNKTLYDNALKSIESYKEKLAPYGADVLDASLKDGALPEAASKIHDDTDIRRLRDMNDLANRYHEELLGINKKLGSMKVMNAAGVLGKEFGDSYMGKKGAKNYREEFDIEPETPGFLSTDERENIKYERLRDIYHVPDEELETADYITLTAAGKQINVRPEAVAFKAGFDQSGEFKPEARAEKTAKARAEYVKPGEAEIAVDEWYNLDAAWTSLPEEDKKKITKHMESTLTRAQRPSVPFHLKDALLQKQEMDKLSVKITAGNRNDAIQILTGDDFGTPAVPGKFGMFGRTEVIPAVIKPWEEKGLSQELYTNLRGLGAKAKDTREAFQHIVRQWDRYDEEDRKIAVGKIISDYKSLIKGF